MRFSFAVTPVFIALAICLACVIAFAALPLLVPSIALALAGLSLTKMESDASPDANCE